MRIFRLEAGTLKKLIKLSIDTTLTTEELRD